MHKWSMAQIQRELHGQCCPDRQYHDWRASCRCPPEFVTIRIRDASGEDKHFAPVKVLRSIICVLCAHGEMLAGAARFFLTKLSIDRNTENIRGLLSVVAVFAATADATAARPSCLRLGAAAAICAC
jgi:hypothetical protein